MKKYLKELIIAGIELALIFLFPLIPMGNKDAHIILIMALTLIIGIIGIAISDKKIKLTTKKVEAIPEEDVVSYVKRIMEDVTDVIKNIPMISEPEISHTNWAEKVEYEV